MLTTALSFGNASHSLWRLIFVRLRGDAITEERAAGGCCLHTLLRNLGDAGAPLALRDPGLQHYAVHASKLQVVREFRAAPSQATVDVYDNNSSDQTAARAAAADARVRREALQGKGNEVRRMFADIAIDVDVSRCATATSATTWPARRR